METEAQAGTGTEAPGMTYRQWLVGMAMQGLTANPAFSHTDAPTIAAWAYEQADAVIEHEQSDTADEGERLLAEL